MTATLSDARALTVSVSSCGGSVPAALQLLLSAADLLMAPGVTQAPIRPIVDAALRGELDAKKLDKLAPTPPTKSPSPTIAKICAKSPNPCLSSSSAGNSKTGPRTAFSIPEEIVHRTRRSHRRRPRLDPRRNRLGTMAEHRATQRGRSVAAATRAPGGCRPRREDRRIVRRQTQRTLSAVHRTRLHRQPARIRRRVVLRRRPQPRGRFGAVLAPGPHRASGITLVRAKAIAAEYRRGRHGFVMNLGVRASGTRLMPTPPCSSPNPTALWVRWN